MFSDRSERCAFLLRSYGVTRQLNYALSGNHRRNIVGMHIGGQGWHLPSPLEPVLSCAGKDKCPETCHVIAMQLGNGIRQKLLLLMLDATTNQRSRK